MDDDTLEETVSKFGGPAYGSSGFGLSEVMTEFLSRDPKFVKVKDLSKLQTSLKATGYLPPTYEVTGAWDSTAQAAFRRSDRDAQDVVYSGNHWASAPTTKALEYFEYAIPGEVFKALIGGAKGLIEQAPETVERLGYGGNVLAGAAIGTAIAPGLGTIIGAGGGLLAAGLSELFGDDEDEEPNRDFWSNVWDSLSPYDEYKEQGAKAFFEDLSFVATFASLGRIPGAAIKGVGAAAAAPVVSGAGRAAGGIVLPGVKAAGQVGFREAFRRAAPGTVAPGMAAKVARSALKHPIIGGAATGATVDALPELLQGDFGQVIPQAARGAVIGATALAGAKKVTPGAIDAAIKGLGAAPLRRIAEAPAAKLSRALFDPISKGTIGARLAGELPGEQTIEKEIDEQKSLIPAPVDIALSTVLYPTSLLPFRPRDIGKAMRSLSSNHVLIPFAENARRVVDPATNSVRYLSYRDGLSRARDMMGKAPDGSFDESLVGLRATFSYLQKGVDDAAREALRGKSFTDDWERAAAFSEQRSKTIGKVFREAGGTEGQVTADQLVNNSKTARTMVEKAMSNPQSMIGYLDNLEGRGTSLDNFVEHQQASEYLQTRSKQVLLDRKGRAFEPGETDRIREEVADEMTREAIVNNPELPGQEAVKTLDKAELERRVAARIPSKAKTAAFTPAVRTDLERGVVGYQTKDDFLGAAKNYEGRAAAFKDAFDNAKGATPDSPLQRRLVETGQALDDTLLDMRRRELIPEPDYLSYRPIGVGAEFHISKELPKRLRGIAEHRPREVTELSQELAQRGLNRYIAVATDENMLFYDQVPKVLEINGIADYTRRQGFYDLIGSLSTKVDDVDLGRRRYNSISAELQGVSDDLGMRLSGKEMSNRIYNDLRTRYDPDFAWKARGEQLSTSLGAIVKRTEPSGKVSRELFKIDPRDLTPDDIVGALKLDEVDNILDPFEAANKIKRAIHVGASFGADAMKFPMHPIQQARAVGRSMKVQGLPGFSDFMRTAHLPTVQKVFPKNSYGYLPQNLHRASMALRYSLSPTFDAGRYLEQSTLGAFRGEIPPAASFAPRRFLERGQWRTPYAAEPVTGETAIKDAMRFYDEEILQRVSMQNFDELQMRLFHKGILGFSPRQAEAAQALYLYNQRAARGAVGSKDIEEIRETIYEIGRYGTGQSPAAKSTHFILFPFLFQAKQVNAMSDFVFGAPMRNLMLHEGMRRWYEVNSQGESYSSRFNDTMEAHLPLANELKRLNNLSYGIGPGRFFLEGIADKEGVGKATQALTSFFVPGGAHQPLQETAGGVADAFKHLFVPVVLVDDGSRKTPMDEILEWGERLAPGYRDLQRWMDKEESPLRTQLTALTEGSTPYAQFQEVMDTKREVDLEFEAVAQQLGYSSWESLGRSDAGAPLKDLADRIDSRIEAEFPSGADMANRFTNTGALKEQSLYSIAHKDDRTDAEEAALAIGVAEEELKGMATQQGVTQDVMFKAAAPIIRRFAVSRTDNRQFVQLWDSLWASQWGPIRAVA